MEKTDHQTFPEFSIVLVNYKTFNLTQKSLALLKSHIDTGLNASIWVVDNHSQDESTSYLRSLDWIHLIERPAPLHPEKGFVAHGQGLNAALEKIRTDYVFVMHTDTFVHDPAIFDQMLDTMRSTENIAAIGCLEQLNRGLIRSAWRFFSRAIKMSTRKLRMKLGINSRPAKPLKEQYIKSFFACWNVNIIRQSGCSFMMGDRNPGYELQDQLKAKGYFIETIEPKKLFKYLEHVKAGTKSTSTRLPVSVKQPIGNQRRTVAA